MSVEQTKENGQVPSVGSGPWLGSVLSAIEAADAKINAKLGYTSNTLAGWWATLTKTGSVEVGWRECCGATHMTAKHRAEWLKIVKKLERAGVRLLVERVKHKNGYATNNGGFWNSEIFRLPNVKDQPRPERVWSVVREGKAWDEIGWDDGPFRIKGGRAIYQSVIHQCGPREGNTVLLARLGNYTGTECRGLEQHNRRVHPDTVLEFLTPNGTS